MTAEYITERISDIEISSEAQIETVKDVIILQENDSHPDSLMTVTDIVCTNENTINIDTEHSTMNANHSQPESSSETDDAVVQTTTTSQYKSKSWKRMKAMIYSLANLIISSNRSNLNLRRNLQQPCFSISQPNESLLLPPTTLTKPVLVVDMDETLIHSKVFNTPQPEIERLLSPDSFYFSINFYSRRLHCYTFIRPHLLSFLKSISNRYECVLFTASAEPYATEIIKKLEFHKSFNHFLFNQHCDVLSGRYTKNLIRLGRDMRQVLILDNSPQSYILNPSNGVPIKSWYGNDFSDTELEKLSSFFEDASYSQDLPEFTRKNLDRYHLDVSIKSPIPQPE